MNERASRPPVHVGGVFPHLGVKAGHRPRRTETGIGALMPWAGRLWMITYVASKAGSGSETGLFAIDDDLSMVRHPAGVVGTYANRMIHHETDTLLIGPHAIDTDGRVKTFDDLVDIRLTATCRHLDDPAERVYVLGMEGEFLELHLPTGKVTHLADLREDLELTGRSPVHFKDAFSRHGRVVVANNSYDASDFDDPHGCDGRLAEWDGTRWTIIRRAQFNTVAGSVGGPLSPAIFAVGQDRASQILMVSHGPGRWDTYRLPKATHTQDHAWTTEWPRIREVESERFLMDAGGLFYELPAMTYAGRVWGLRPISTHLRIVGDFCSWNGLLVVAGDQTTPIGDTNAHAGQPQAGLWFGKTDDLWSFGKPAGWGGPWFRDPVRAGEPSNPFLMTGFEHACLHLAHDAGQAVQFRMEVDFLGCGEWHAWETLTVGADGYACRVLPDGFSAHWVRLVPQADCTATARFVYT
ncbi:MAG: hypothetical protein ACOC95_01740 [Planctomycetota bacterium]